MNKKYLKEKMIEEIEIAVMYYNRIKNNIFRLEEIVHNNHLNNIERYVKAICEDNKEMHKSFYIIENLFSFMNNKYGALLLFSSFVLYSLHTKKYLLFQEEDGNIVYKYYVKNGKIKKENRIKREIIIKTFKGESNEKKGNLD